MAEVKPPCLGAQPSLLFPLSSSSFLSEPLVGLSVSEQGNKDSNRVWFGSAAQIVPECREPSDGESRVFNPQAVGAFRASSHLELSKSVGFYQGHGIKDPHHKSVEGRLSCRSL